MEVPGSFKNICRSDAEKAKITLVRDESPRSDQELIASVGKNPPTPHPVDRKIDGLPFVNIASYPDGTSEPMMSLWAENYCKNPRYVTQPAHLPTAEEMIRFTMSRGARGIVQLAPGEKLPPVSRNCPSCSEPMIHDDYYEDLNKLVDLAGDKVQRTIDFSHQYVSLDGYQPMPFADDIHFWTSTSTQEAWDTTWNWKQSGYAYDDTYLFFFTPRDGSLRRYEGGSGAPSPKLVGCLPGL